MRNPWYSFLRGGSDETFTTIAAAIFLLMALVHVYRVTVGFPVKVGTLEITQAISWIALIVSLVLAVGLFREARR